RLVAGVGWCQISSRREGKRSAEREAIERVGPESALVQVGTVRTEGQLNDPVAREVMTLIEPRCPLFEIEPVKILHRRSNCSADAGGVIDRVRVSVGDPHRD